MKKVNKREIIILIILIIMLIIQIRAFTNSRANNLTDITAKIVDSSGLLSEETFVITAINEAESGMAITLPNIINTKKINKYIITKKEIIETTETVNTTEAAEENLTVDMLPGEKIYLTQEEIENKEIILTAEYDTIEVNTQILYNKKLTVKDADDYELLSVSGYMPYDAEIEANEIDITNIENEILQNYPNTVVAGNYDIKLISNEEEYIAKDYEQALDIEISINDENLKHNVLEMQDNNIQELKEITIESNKIKFTTEELKPYLILEENQIEMYAEEPIEETTEGTTQEEETTANNAITTYAVGGEDAKLEIDDFESDKNYYLGLNYTEEMSKTNSGKYTESNLKEVQINYYGYDYDLTEFVVPEEHEVTLNATAQRSATGNVSTIRDGRTTYYVRTDTIRCTVTGINNLKQQYPDFNANSDWILQMAVPNNNFSNYFYETGTAEENSSNGISVSVSNGTITVVGTDVTNIIESNGDTCTFTFYVTFRATRRNNITNTSFSTLTVNSFTTTITIGDYTPYGTISDTEEQTLVSYRKCVPVDSSGNITINLIDNPFMNRPLERGFNGWKTNNLSYSNSITTNTNTFEQTLTTNINNIIDSSGKYVINLYADWVEANVIFVSSSGNSLNTGTSPNSPINNNWTTINNKINANIKTCTHASNREVNIIVLMNGTLDVSGLTGPNTPYTLTSLYNGINYGNTSTYLSIGTTDVELDSDLQINNLYVSTNRSYSSPTGTTDGTSAVTPCLYANMYNLRIGRGVVPTNSNYCTWAQIQGGYYNHQGLEYRLVIETGKYYTIQLYRASSNYSSATDTTANATMVLGSDIDRRNNNNEVLKIYNRMASRTTSATASPYLEDGIVVNMIVKSGTFGIDYFNNASTSDNSERNYAGIYVGGHGDTGYDKSDRYLLVEGGNIANIIGGLSMAEEDMFKTYMYVKGGNVLNITGGAGYTHTYGDRIIQVTGGYVKYSISGGSNGVAASSSSNNGQLTGESLIYVGGTAQIGASSTIDANGNEIVTVTSSDEVLYGVNAGSVCGGANGNSNYAGQTDASYIIIDGDAIIHNNVFGGGNYGIIGSQNVQGASILEFKNETSNFTANTEYLITTSTSGENGLSASGNSLTNEGISTAVEPSARSKWIFENYSGNQYYIKNASTGQYIYISRINSSLFSCDADIELSTTNKSAFTVEGTTTKTISAEGSTWFSDVTMYLNYNNGWVLSSNRNSYQLYLLTYEILSPDETTDDLDTLVNIKVLGGNIVNNVYGGANQNNIYGTVDIDIEDGVINGVVYGGSNIRGTISGAVLMDISGGQLGEPSTTQDFDYSSVDVAFGGGLGVETDVKGRVLININETKNNLNIYGNVYGGSSLGTISNNININIQDLPTTPNILSIQGYVFGGGEGDNSTSAEVAQDITINVDGCNLSNCTVFGGSNINGTINGTITVNIGATYNSTLYAVYGGGNQASIGTETQGVYIYILDNANITKAFNGGNEADLISTGVEDTTRAIYLQGGTAQDIYGGSDLSGTVTASHVFIEAGNATNVYGGNNQGGITQTTNVIINGGKVTNAYGGGNQAVTNETNVNINGEVLQNVFGGGNQAGVNTNTNVNIIGATIGDNVYGGGNEGIVTGNTYVRIKNSTINNSLYAGGNGVSAIVYGNTNLIMEAKNNVINNVFGGGNQAATGTEANNNSQSIVNIAGGTIGKNVYGGANTSVVYGTTQTNIGYDTIGDDSLEIGDIYIGGTVFGGGEANASGSEVFDFDFISVTVGIDIQIDGNGYENFAILGSIFGSGNASSTSGTSYITIKNYGTPEKPQSNVSLQRTNCATIINSAISLSGATDRTNEYSGTFFSISRVDQVKLKNNSVLYLCNGANLLKKLDSLVDENGTEVKGVVTINEETGEITKNVDNRIYMLEGKNLNVALDEKATLFGQVQGMFFFGLFTNKNNPVTSTGLYHNGYNNGDEITNTGTFVSNSYVMAEHYKNPEHDIKADGFYTNYNQEGIIKTDYITPTPEDSTYYMWLCGKNVPVKEFNIEMVASKYATLGTYQLALLGFETPNLKMTIAGFSSGLINEVSLVDPSEIESIELDENKANTQFGLSMETGNIGWQTKGETMFLTEDGGTYTGTTNYDSDNTNYTPILNFYFYHSQNLSEKEALGDVTIRMQVMTPVDDLNYSVSYIHINIVLSTALFQDDYYEAAMTPGQEFGLFTTSDTTITESSTFSTYYSLVLEDFSTREDAEEFPNYTRVLVSRDSEDFPCAFPENTKITMLDMATNKFYYYIVTAEDVANGKYIYSLSDFIAMGSNDNNFNEDEMFSQYYNEEEDILYENFIFHVNFADSNITENIIENSLLIELRNEDSQTMLGVLGIQRENMVYTVYLDKEATINVDGTIEPETIYLGDDINLNVTTTFTQELIGTKTIYDTQYFDKKLGIKISIYDINGNRLNNDSLLGINFELDGRYYYPRIDGTTRISIADKVTDVLAKLKINTENNTTLATGDYKIRIESFGSSDGIYYGLVASDMVELDLRVINFAYGLKAVTPDKAKIIDKETGQNENGDNSISTVLEYSSSLSDPNIAISLYRRDYSEVFSQDYALVDLNDYVEILLTPTKREKEYVISTNPLANTTYFLYLKPDLVTGTYKLVYKLYDGDTYIGETYEYMIIK